MPEPWELEIANLKTRILELQGDLKAVKEGAGDKSAIEKLQNDISTLKAELGAAIAARPVGQTVPAVAGEDESDAGFWSE